MGLSFGSELPSRAAAPVLPVESGEEAVRAADSDGDGVPDRPDLVSAGVTARVLGVAVEDLSQRTGQVRVMVNPDGTLEQESLSARRRAAHLCHRPYPAQG